MSITVTSAELSAIGFNPTAWAITGQKTRQRVAALALRTRGDAQSNYFAQLLEQNNPNAIQGLSLVWTSPA